MEMRELGRERDTKRREDSETHTERENTDRKGHTKAGGETDRERHGSLHILCAILLLLNGSTLANTHALFEQGFLPAFSRNPFYRN